MKMARFPLVIFLIGVGFIIQSASAAEVKYTGGRYPDPFFKTVEKKVVETADSTESKLKAMTVQGVSVSMGNPRAIINGKIYHVGSLVEDAKVLRINKDGVVVSTRAGKEVQIPIRKRVSVNDKTKKV